METFENIEEQNLKNEELEENSLVIPELKETKTWVNWIYSKTADGKTTKVPRAFDGTPVGTDIKYKHKWCDYKTAKCQIDDDSANGIGLIFNDIKLDNQRTFAVAGIDIDQRDLEDPVIKDIISMMGTYAEKSPSGNGIHLLFLVDTSKLPENFKETYYMKNPQNKIEAYVSGFTNRFFTFTEDIICNKPLNERTEQFLQFLNKYMLRDVASSNNEVTECNDTLIKDNPVPLNNQIIVDVILKTKQADKFYKLFFQGDTSEYGGDNSSADLGLATILAFYVGPNPERIDNLMKQSKLYRTKWERPDYKEMTIKKAIQCCNGNFFDWRNEEISDESYSKAMIESLTAEELMQLNLPPLIPIVKNLLFPGVSILAGAPKVGKSWACLDLCISVCKGEAFMGFDTNKNETLYLALEDSVHRLKNRMEKVLGVGQPAPAGFHIATSCNTLDNGLLAELQNTLNQNPNIKLIIIDTLQKVRGAQVRGETWYGCDYRETGMLKKFADINKVCILAISHLRKQKDADKFNQISGSTGLIGAADTMIVLDKIPNGNGEILMSVTGRDVDYSETVIKFNKNTFKWEIASKSTDYESYRQQLDYDKNPIVKTIKLLVSENPDGFTITATELLKRIHDLMGVVPKQNKPQTLSRELNERLQFLLWDYDKIYYESSNSNGGSAGRKMYFSKQKEKKFEY